MRSGVGALAHVGGDRLGRGEGQRDPRLARRARAASPGAASRRGGRAGRSWAAVGSARAGSPCSRPPLDPCQQTRPARRPPCRRISLEVHHPTSRPSRTRGRRRHRPRPAARRATPKTSACSSGTSSSQPRSASPKRTRSARLPSSSDPISASQPEARAPSRGRHREHDRSPPARVPGPCVSARELGGETHLGQRAAARRCRRPRRILAPPGCRSRP